MIEVREEVMWFTKQMEKKLLENDHKGGWEHCSNIMLLARLFEESEELDYALGHPNSLGYTRRQVSSVEDSISEAADVANFAMMIADKARKSLPSST